MDSVGLYQADLTVFSSPRLAKRLASKWMLFVSMSKSLRGYRQRITSLQKSTGRQNLIPLLLLDSHSFQQSANGAIRKTFVCSYNQKAIGNRLGGDIIQASFKSPVRILGPDKAASSVSVQLSCTSATGHVSVNLEQLLYFEAMYTRAYYLLFTGILQRRLLFVVSQHNFHKSYSYSLFVSQ